MAEEKHRILLDEFEEDTYETEKEIPKENSSEKRGPKAAKSDTPKKKKAAQGKKQSLMGSIKDAFSKEPKEEIPEMWTGVPSQQKWIQKSFKKRNESYSFFCFRKTAAFIPRFA